MVHLLAQQRYAQVAHHRGEEEGGGEGDEEEEDAEAEGALRLQVGLDDDDFDDSSDEDPVRHRCPIEPSGQNERLVMRGSLRVI